MKTKLKNGKLILTTETKQDRKVLADKCDDPYKLIKIMEGKNYSKHYGDDKRPYHKVTSILPAEYITPFYKLISDRIKKEANKTQTFDLLPLIEQGHKGILCHYTTLTYIMGEITASGYIDAEEWNGMTSKEYAQSRFDKYLKVMFGVEWSPAEHYHSGGNSLRYNQYYASGHRSVCPFGVIPQDMSKYHWKNYSSYNSLSKHWLMVLLFSTINLSDGQKAIVDGYNILHKQFNSQWWDTYQGWHVEPTKEVKALNIGKPCSWSSHEKEDKLYITKDEFDKLA